MSEKTGIQWTDSTANPVMGCEGCELYSTTVKVCYAAMLHSFRAGNRGYAPTFDRPTLFPGRMAKAARWSDLTGQDRGPAPWRNGLPRLIFISDMGDALSTGVSFDYLAVEIIDVVMSVSGARHEWLWPTKRPKRMVEFCHWLRDRGIDWPPNLWAGTSITEPANLGRARDLLGVGDDRTIHFLSIEPQIAAIPPMPLVSQVDWVIQGGESGSGSRPFDLRWAREMRDACADAGTPYFLKQLGKRPVCDGAPIKLRDGHGGDWLEWPEDLRVRQFPIQPGRRAGTGKS
jgi:protein gp37